MIAQHEQRRCLKSTFKQMGIAKIQ